MAFYLFFSMESALIFCYKTAIAGIKTDKNQSKMAFKSETQHIESFLYGADIPALIGATIIFVVGVSLELGLNFPDFEHDLAFFRQGFVIGAVSLHVTISQTSVAFIGLLNSRKHAQNSTPLPAKT